MILVTGASGLLGSFITNELLEKGEKVIGLVRSSSDLSLLDSDHPSLTLYEGDIMDLVSLERLFTDFSITAVIHTAAIVSFQPDDYDKMYQVNVIGTRNMVDVSLKYEAERFLHISSVAALGRSSKGKVTEKTKWFSGSFNSKYGISKKEAEIEVWRGQVEGLSTLILNPSLILAPADGKRSSSKLFKFISKDQWFYPVGDLNYVDIRDVVEVVLKVLDMKLENDRYIVSAGAISYKDFFTKVATLGGYRVPKFPVKKIFAYVALFMDNTRSFISRQRPMLSTESLRVSRSKVVFDNSKIKDKLNFRFRSLDDSVKWVWKEFNS